MADSKAAKRNTNLELYRIILMLFIVAHHYVVNSGLMETAVVDGLNIKSFGILLFGAWGKIGINCFLLITGYYMYKSKASIKKFLRLLLEIEFYNILFYFIFIIFGYEKLSFSSIFRTIVPFSTVTTNFVGCFLLFYIGIPFINKLLHNLTGKQHLMLMALLLFTYTILGSVPKSAVSFNYVLWFSVIYVIGAFIRRCFDNGMRPKYRYAYGGGLLICLATSIASIPLCWTSLGSPYFLIMDANKILAVATSVMMFLYFKNLKIKYNSRINMIASATFGVLLIHANSDAMRAWLWRDTFRNNAMYNEPLLFVHAIVATVVVFAICVCIDLARMKIFEKHVYIYTDRFASKLERKVRNVV